MSVFFWGEAADQRFHAVVKTSQHSVTFLVSSNLLCTTTARISMNLCADVTFLSTTSS